MLLFYTKSKAEHYLTHELLRSVFSYSKEKTESFYKRYPDLFDEQLLISIVRIGNLDLLRWMYEVVYNSEFEKRLQAIILKETITFAQYDMLGYVIKLCDDISLCDENGLSIIQSPQINQRVAKLLLDEGFDITVGKKPNIFDEALNLKRKKQINFLLENVRPVNVKTIQQISKRYHNQDVHIQYFYIEICKFMEEWFTKNLHKEKKGIQELLDIPTDLYEASKGVLYDNAVVAIDRISGGKIEDNYFQCWKEQLPAHRAVLPEELYATFMYLLKNKQDFSSAKAVHITDEDANKKENVYYSYKQVREYAEDELKRLQMPKYSMEDFGLMLPENWHKSIR